MYDVVIIGGGPAGLTAAIYTGRSGLKTLVIEKLVAGGQITSSDILENFPGFETGIGGFEFGQKLRSQAQKFGAEFIESMVSDLDLTSKIKKIAASAGEYEAKAVVLAMGKSPRHLGLENEQTFTGAGISYCATCDGAFFKDKVVAIVGGGDTAFEDALYLKNLAKKVYLIHRRDEFRAQDILVERAKSADNIEFILSSIPNKLLGSVDFEGVQIKDLKTQATFDLSLDGFFIAIGQTPNTELVKEMVTTNENGYIIANEDTKTDIAGVFAAGDIRTKPLRQVITAAADGAVAGAKTSEYLNAIV